MPVIMFLLIAGILGCMLAMVAVAVQGSEGRPVPPVEPRPLLVKKEIAMYNDLNAVCQKISLQVSAKVPLSLVVQAREERRTYALSKRLQGEILPFLLLHIQSGKPVMAVLNAEYQSDLGLRVMDDAKIPYIKLNNYNLPGLEKVLRDKLGAVLSEQNSQGKKAREIPHDFAQAGEDLS